MSYKKIKTEPDLSLSSEKHQDAIKKGTNHFHEKNVCDSYKECTDEFIKQDMLLRSLPFAVMFENWINDFNIATGIRNANAFNAREVFYIGNKKWDRRGAVGTYNYTSVNFLKTKEEILSLKEKYTFIGIDNVPGSIDIFNFKWKPNSLLIFGEEAVGLTDEIQSMCDYIVNIPMFGSVRSLNCGTASGIAMYDYTFKSLNEK